MRAVEDVRKILECSEDSRMLGKYQNAVKALEFSYSVGSIDQQH